MFVEPAHGDRIHFWSRFMIINECLESVIGLLDHTDVLLGVGPKVFFAE